MERLTELKVGLQLNADVLEAWCRPKVGKNLAHYNEKADEPITWIHSTNVYGNDQPLPITELRFADNYFRIKNRGLSSLCFRWNGFIEFYNNFYNLGSSNSIKQWKKEDFYNTKIQLPNKELSKRFYDLITSLGFEPIKNSQAAIESGTFFMHDRSDLTYSSSKDLMGYSTNYKVLKWQDIFPDSSQPQSVRTNFDGCKVWCKDINQMHDVIEKLMHLGYVWHENTTLQSLRAINFNIGSDGGGIYINKKGGVGEYMGWDKKEAWNKSPLTTIDISEILGKQIINTIHTPLNTKTDGKAIIVRSPVATITGRKRPEGTAISGKKSTTTVGVGYLSHRTISS